MKTRKELKDEYKQMTFRMGVFGIRNLATGKIYVGRATNLDLIWKGEQFKLNLGGHPNKALQEDWNASGGANFAFEVLHELKPPEDPTQDMREELKALEQMVREELRAGGKLGG